MAINELELGDIEGNVPANGQQKPAVPRARLVSVSVQLNVVADDGETLHPLQVAPVQVVANDWKHFDLDAQIADIQAQLGPRAVEQ